MTNLADLLPAGGGQNNTEFVADGNISAGAPVILTSNAKAAAIVSSAVGQSFGSATEFEAATASYIGMCYDTNHDRVILTYRDEGNSSYGTAVVLEISGTTITVGTPLVFDSSSTSFHSCAFDPNNYGYVINCYRGSSNYGYMCVLYYNGSNTLAAGSPTTFDSSGNTYRINTCYFPPTQRTLVAYRDYSTGYPKGRSISLSGTTPSAGNATSIASTGTYVMDSVYDVSSGLIAYVYVNNSSNVLAGNVIYVNSTTISVGTATTLQSENCDWVAISYDSVLQKNLVAYSTSASDLKGTIVTTGDSPYSISADTASDSGEQGTNLGLAFDTRAEKHGLFFRNQTTTKACVMPVTTTASGITWGSITDLDSSGQWNHNIARYDPDQQVLVNAAYEAYSPNYSNAIAGYFAYESTNLTATNLLGLAPEAISDTATGTINTWGSRCESTKLGGTGLSMGATAQYSASNLADIYASQAVFDSTNNKMVIVYDGAGSGAGYGIVGTISGTSISYGSAVQYSGGNAYFSQATYDSTNQRVVVAYADSANSNYLTGVVGTVSGTSISWGTPVVADSTANDFYIGIDFDINAGKVLIIWKDNSTAYNYSIVGTVSGTSISFGTKVAIDTTYGYQQIGGLTYDPNAQKHLFTRPRTSGSVMDSYVGTVSGTSVSWGSAVSLTTTQYFYDAFSAYEAPSQKLGVVFTNASDSTLGTLVATISGTSVSYGSLVNVGAGAYTAPGVYYDATAGEFVAQGKLSNNLLAYRGTLSGTTISWGAAQTVAADADFGSNVGIPGYDTNAGKGLFQWANAGATAADSGVASIGDLPLTIGTDYYVQSDGTISTTSTSPAQLIGNAIKTNQINIKDYTG